MKIGIIGATGKAGNLIMAEALKRNLDVTAIVRHPERLQAKVPYLQKDLFAVTQADLVDFDIVIDAFNAPVGQEEMHLSSIKHLIDLLTGTDVRLMVVGGAGSLYVSPDVQLVDAPDFPDAFKPTASMMRDGLQLLENSHDLKWTYISPAADFRFAGARTGKYRLGTRDLPVNQDGQSVVSYADYAQAFIDEAVAAKHLNQQISVVSQ